MEHDVAIHMTDDNGFIAKHFDDCPYGCNPQGKLLDSNSGKMVVCPHCSEKRKNIIKSGFLAERMESQEDTKEEDTYKNRISSSIYELFGLGRNLYLSGKFIYENVIPDSEILFLDDKSIGYQKEISESLYNSLLLGELPSISYCFGLGIKGSIEKFVYPMMVTAYKNNLNVSKLITASKFTQMCIKQDELLDSYYESDIVFMVLNDGCTNADFANAKGLMQTRGLGGKPTVFVTSWTIDACGGLLGFKGRSDYDSLLLAKPVFVRYTDEKSPTAYVRAILGEKCSPVPRNPINGVLGTENKIGGYENVVITPSEPIAQSLSGFNGEQRTSVKVKRTVGVSMAEL